METKLKECPLCGYESISRYTDAKGYFVLQCGRCGAQLANYNYLPVDEWNNRANENRLRRMIEYALDAPEDARAIKTILFDALNGYDGFEDIDEFRAKNGSYEISLLTN
jgi:ribosomal protein L37AE/L43A